MNKLSELSKPYGYEYVTAGRGHVEMSRTLPPVDMREVKSLYSQEYVSALLSELEATRKQSQELAKQCGRLGARAAIAERKLATPAPAYPEILPCAVRLMPGVIFGEGVRTSIMLDGLRRREEHNAEMAAMTPEQKDEQSAAIKALFSRMTPPAPAVPDAISTRLAITNMERHELCGSINVAYKHGWNDFRAAMLAQPVSQGYKLVPVEPTSQVIAPFIKHCCENEAWVRQAWREMLAAVP